MNQQKGKRIIGLDMHPDVFAAAALDGGGAAAARVLWVQARLPSRGQARLPTAGFKAWAKKQLKEGRHARAQPHPLLPQRALRAPDPDPRRG